MKRSFVLFAASALLCNSCVTLDLRPTKRIEPLAFELGQADSTLVQVFPESYDLTWYAELNDQLQLDSLCQDALNSHQCAIEVMNRVHTYLKKPKRQYHHSGNAALYLDQHEDGDRLPADAHAKVMTACIHAVGLPARNVFLMTNDCQETKRDAGHYLTEVWIDEQQRWAMFDPTFNLAPVLGDLALGSVDLQLSIINNRPYRFVRKGGEVSEKERTAYLKFIPHRLFYFATAFDQRIAPDTVFAKNGFAHLLLVPSDIEAPVVFQRSYPLEKYKEIRSKEWFNAPPPFSESHQ